MKYCKEHCDYFLNLSAHISAVQRRLLSFPKSRLRAGWLLWRGWPDTDRMPFQAGDITAVFRWHIQVWRVMLSSFSHEAKSPAISARFHGNEEKKDWPALLSNSEFQHPANRDQDPLPGLGTPHEGVCLCETLWGWQHVSYRRLRVLRTGLSPWRNVAPASLLLGKYTKQNSWGKDPTSSRKTHSVCHTIHHFILFSHRPISLSSYLGLRFIWCQAFVFIMQVLFLVSSVQETQLHPLLGRKSTPGWCSYLPGRQEPYTGSSAPGKPHPIQKDAKGTDQKHRHLQRMATGHHHWFPSASHCQALSSVPLEHYLT